MPSTIDHPAGKGGGWEEPPAEDRTKIPVRVTAAPVPPPDVCDVCVRRIYLEANGAGAPVWKHWDPALDMTWPRIHVFDDNGTLQDITLDRNCHQAVPRIIEYRSGSRYDLRIMPAPKPKSGGIAA